MRLYSSIQVIFLLTVVFYSTSCQEYPRRTLQSSSSFITYTVYFKHIMGNSSDNILIPTNIGKYLNGSNYLSFFQGFNGIFHYSNFSGYQMVSYLKNITSTSVSIEFLAGFCKDICIANYYHYQVTLMLVPNQAPFRRQFTPSYPYPSVIGYPNSTQYIKGNVQVWFQITEVFKNACYYDSSKKTKDKISIWHTFNANAAIGVMDLQAVSPTGKWQFDFSNSDSYIVYNITFGAYYADIQYITAVVVGWCPNSYVFSNSGIYVYSNPNKVLEMPANTQGFITQIQYSQSVAITNMPAFTFSYLKMDLMSMTLSFSSAFFNVTPFYDANGTNIPNSLRFWFINNMPNNSRANYMILGSYGGCYKNFQLYNNTHCFCNQSSWFYYKPQISYSSCVLQCPSSMYSPSAIETCINCNSTFGYGCSVCTEKSCQKCISSLILFVNGSFSACYNCSNLFGLLCSSCNNIQCFSCFQNYFIFNNSCQCFGDRFKSSNGACNLCNYTYIGCKTCNQSQCNQCDQNFTLTNRSCYCNNNFILQVNRCICPASNYLFKYNSCQLCSKFYSGCVSCTDNGCNSCKVNYILTIGQCQCTGDRYIMNSSCILCNDTYKGCIICTINVCTRCAQNFILSNFTCVCQSPYNLLIDANNCSTCPSLIQGCSQCISPNNCTLCSNGYQAITISGKNFCECISKFYLNKTCIICNIYYGFGCSTCFDQCLTCINYYAITNSTAVNIFNPCQPCYLLYTNCINCNSNACTQCLSTFILVQGGCLCSSNSTNINNVCIQCQNLFQYCASCNQSNCKTCPANFILANNSCTCINDRYIINSTCILCQISYPHCNNCTITTCYRCIASYILISNRCLCFGTDRFEQNNQCVTCIMVLRGCLQCKDRNNCLKCIQKNYTRVNAKCQCSFGYALINNSCILCSDIFGFGCYLCNQTNCLFCKQGFGMSSYIFGQICLSCSIIDRFCYQCSFQNGSKCTQCMYNFTLSIDQQACICSDSRTIIQNKCILCKDTFSNCKNCNQSQCLQCNSGFQNNKSSCICRDNEYQFAQTCLLCQLSYPNCRKCNIKECISCKQNFTYYNRQCTCMAPKIYSIVNQSCIQCKNIHGSDFCEFKGQMQWLQIGNDIFFKFSFNKPQEQINIIVPLRYNLKITSKNKIIPIEDFGQIMKFKLLQDINKQTIFITILQKSYIKWKEISISQNPSPISLTYKVSFIPQWIESYLFQYISLIEKSLIGIGACSTNRLFQQTRMISLMTFNTNIQNCCGRLAFLFLKSEQIGELQIRDSLKDYVFGFKQPFVKRYSNHLLLGLLSSFFLIYIRGYIKSKRNHHKKQFFKIFEIYWIQIFVENNISFINSISFFMMLSIKKMIQSNRQSTNTNTQLLCGIFGIGLLIIFFILLLVQLKEINKHQYYGWWKIDQTYKKVIYFLDLIRPLVISLLLGFLSESPAIYFAILAINCIHIIAIGISIIYCTNKLIITIKILKSALSLFITVQIIISYDSDSILSTISYLSAIIIIIIEVVQVLVKIVLLFLTKSSIKLSQKYQKQKQIDNIQRSNLALKKETKKDRQIPLSDLLKIKQDLMIIKMQNKKRKNT